MKIRTQVKAGGVRQNHNETQARGLKVRTSVQAGAIAPNHNETLLR
jgi:hypothetical protein